MSPADETKSPTESIQKLMRYMHRVGFNEIRKDAFGRELCELCDRFSVTIATFGGETKAVSKEGWSIDLE